MHSSTNPCVLLLPYLDSWIYILVILVHYILIHIPRTSIKKLRESTRGTSDRENCEDTHKHSQSAPTFSGLVMHKVLLNLYSNIICNFLGRFRVIVVSSNIHWNYILKDVLRIQFWGQTGNFVNISIVWILLNWEENSSQNGTSSDISKSGSIVIHGIQIEFEGKYWGYG